MKNGRFKKLRKTVFKALQKNRYLRRLRQFISAVDIESRLPEWAVDLYPNYRNNYRQLLSIVGVLQLLAIDEGEESTKVNSEYTQADIVYERLLDVGAWFARRNVPQKLQWDHTLILQAYAILAFHSFSDVQQSIILANHLEHNSWGVAKYKLFYLTRKQRETLVYIFKRTGIKKTMDEIPQTFTNSSLKKFLPQRVIDQKDEIVEEIMKLKDQRGDKIEFLFQKLINLTEGQKVHLLLLLSDMEYTAIKERIENDRVETLKKLEKTDWLPKLIWLKAHSALKYGAIGYLHAAEKRREIIKRNGTYSALDDKEFEFIAKLDMERLKNQRKQQPLVIN